MHLRRRSRTVLHRRYGRASKPSLESVRYNIQGVLAGAYRGRGTDVGQRRTLTHVALLDPDGYAIRALCRTVPGDSLVGYPSNDEEPTCPKCLARLPGFIARGATFVEG